MVVVVVVVVVVVYGGGVGMGGLKQGVQKKIVLPGRRKAYLWPETVVTILIVRKMASKEVKFRLSSGLQPTVSQREASRLFQGQGLQGNNRF
jgi:hypothetical protein